MPHTVIGLFGDLPTTQRAEAALTEAGFEHEQLFGEALVPSHALSGEGVPPVPTGDHADRVADWASKLIKHGVPEERARALASAIQENGAAVILFGLEDSRAEEAAALLSNLRPLDPTRRLEAFHELGHSGYNPVANPFTGAEAASDRTRFADEHLGTDVAVVLVM